MAQTRPFLKLLLVSTLAALALLTSVALGSPAGDLDPSFDRDGKLILPDPSAGSEVLVQEDGKILVVGNGGPDGDFVVARLRPDGSPDRTWGDEGRAFADFGGDDRANAAAIQPDGKVVVAGPSDSPTSATTAVARFDPRGKLDPTFDPGGPDGDGKKLLPLGIVHDAAAVLVQPDGKIVLAGQGFSEGRYDMAITRLTPTGEVDGTDWERGRFDAPANAYAGALTPDGKIIVAGTHHPATSTDEIALARFDSDGKLDKTLGGTGKVTFASEGNEGVAAVLVQPDGKIAVAGTSYASGFDMVVTRFDRDGTPDASWDGDGRAFADFKGQSIGDAAALQPDGKIVVAGISANELDIAVARFNPTGAPDVSFGSAGASTVAGGFIEVANAVALQRDGRVVAAGQSVGGTPVVRLLADPRPSDRAGAGGGPLVDRDAPLIGPVKLTPAAFAVARGRTAPAARRGTTIRYSLSEAARVTLSFKRAVAGRRVGRSCRPITARTRHRRPCRRYVAAGTLRRTGRVGSNRVAFRGRIGRRALRRGAHRLIVTAVDAAGNRSAARTKAFRIVRGRTRPWDQAIRALREAADIHRTQTRMPHNDGLERLLNQAPEIRGLPAAGLMPRKTALPRCAGSDHPRGRGRRYRFSAAQNSCSPCLPSRTSRTPACPAQRGRRCARSGVASAVHGEREESPSTQEPSLARTGRCAWAWPTPGPTSRSRTGPRRRGWFRTRPAG